MRLPTAQTPTTCPRLFFFFFSPFLGIAACDRSESQATSAQVAAPATPEIASNPPAASKKAKANGLPAPSTRSAAADSPLTDPPRPRRPPKTPGATANTIQGSDARKDQFADLQVLCAALNKDYVDGTLTDYYKNLSMKTAFGNDLRRRGEASMEPGRILEAGLQSLRQGKKQSAHDMHDPAIPACTQLFDELDDLE